MGEAQIGSVTHFFDKIGVAVITITDGDLRVGDTIHIKGHTTDLTVPVQSMQIERQPVAKVTVGQTVGIQVGSKCHPHDKVSKVQP